MTSLFAQRSEASLRRSLVLTNCAKRGVSKAAAKLKHPSRPDAGYRLKILI